MCLSAFRAVGFVFVKESEAPPLVAEVVEQFKLGDDLGYSAPSRIRAMSSSSIASATSEIWLTDEYSLIGAMVTIVVVDICLCCRQ